MQRQKLLQKTKDRYHNYSQEKDAKYYISNKEFLKENTKNNTETYQKEKKRYNENLEQLNI